MALSQVESRAELVSTRPIFEHKMGKEVTDAPPGRPESRCGELRAWWTGMKPNGRLVRRGCALLMREGEAIRGHLQALYPTIAPKSVESRLLRRSYSLGTREMIRSSAMIRLTPLREARGPAGCMRTSFGNYEGASVKFMRFILIALKQYEPETK